MEFVRIEKRNWSVSSVTPSFKLVTVTRGHVIATHIISVTSPGLTQARQINETQNISPLSNSSVFGCFFNFFFVAPSQTRTILSFNLESVT